MKDEKREESFSCAVCGKTVRVTLKPGDHLRKVSFGLEDGVFACTTCVGENRGMYFDVGYNTWRWNVSLDWGKVRRRVEDALRKTDDKSVLLSFANRLNVKIY